MNTTSLTSKSRAYFTSLLLLVLAVVSAHQWWMTSIELEIVKEARIDLTGTVTLDSLPLQSGVFQLTNAEGQSISAPIKQGKFQVASIPAGEWQQSLSGPVVPSLYHSMGEMTIHASIRCLQFGLQGRSSYSGAR